MPGTALPRPSRTARQAAGPLRHSRRDLRFGLTAIRELRRCTRGAAAIEFAVLTTVLVLLALGAVDFGRIGLEKAQLTQVARAGVQYGVQSQTSAYDTDGMVQAARADAADADGLIDITARSYCSCAGEGEVVCTISCADGNYAPLFVEVTAQDEVEMYFTYPGVSSPVSVTSTSTMRVR